LTRIIVIVGIIHVEYLFESGFIDIVPEVEVLLMFLWSALATTLDIFDPS
jgi:hypothetical protein